MTEVVVNGGSFFAGVAVGEAQKWAERSWIKKTRDGGHIEAIVWSIIAEVGGGIAAGVLLAAAITEGNTPVALASLGYLVDKFEWIGELRGNEPNSLEASK